MKPLTDPITRGFFLPQGPTTPPSPAEGSGMGGRGGRRREVQGQQNTKVSAVVVSIFTPFMFFQF